MLYRIAMVIYTQIDLQKNFLKYKKEIAFTLGYHKLDNNVTTPLPAQRWLFSTAASLLTINEFSTGSRLLYTINEFSTGGRLLFKINEFYIGLFASQISIYTIRIL